jgi:hypothetical protein
MGQKLSSNQMELYRRVDEVLHYIWDPIGVSGVPEARDEYHRYLPQVFSMLVRDAPSVEIINFLVATATETMGLGGRRNAFRRAREVTEILKRWQRVIADRPPTA